MDESVSLRLRYECSTVEDFSLQEPEKYDGVVASEIIEHVANQPQFVTSCCQLVRVRISFDVCKWLCVNVLLIQLYYITLKGVNGRLTNSLP